MKNLRIKEYGIWFKNINRSKTDSLVLLPFKYKKNVYFCKLKPLQRSYIKQWKKNLVAVNEQRV